MQAQKGKTIFAWSAKMLAAYAVLGVGAADAAFKEIRDTWVLCDFAENCTLNLKAQKADTPLTLQIYRGSATDQPVQLRLTFQDDAEDKAPPKGEIALSVDGKVAIAFNADMLKKIDGTYVYDNEKAMAALLELMYNGHVLSVKADDHTYTYSLAGLVAGQIYIDEQQDRAGTVAALQAKGSKPAPQAPQVRMFDSPSQLPASISANFTGDDSVCGGSSNEHFRQAGAFEAKIADDLFLLGLPCGAPGAYNQSYVFYSRSGDRTVPISLPVMGDEGPTVTNSAWNIDWSQKTHRLTAFYKGRGLGDCGSYDVWKAQDSEEDSVRFVLVEERVKDECDGNYAGGPEKWPLTWPLKATQKPSAVKSK